MNPVFVVLLYSKVTGALVSLDEVFDNELAAHRYCDEMSALGSLFQYKYTRRKVCKE